MTDKAGKPYMCYLTSVYKKRLQRNLGVLTPVEKHEQYLMAA